jgi:hypothetical protein
MPKIEIKHSTDEELYAKPSRGICCSTAAFENFCLCKFGMIGSCGKTPEDAKQYFINYYRTKADYIEKMSIDQFLQEFVGIYEDK